MEAIHNRRKPEYTDEYRQRARDRNIARWANMTDEQKAEHGEESSRNQRNRWDSMTEEGRQAYREQCIRVQAPQEVRAKHSANMRNRRANESDEQREHRLRANGDAHKRYWESLTPEQRTEVSAARSIKHKDPVFRAKWGEAEKIRCANRTEEEKAALRQAMREGHSRPEVQAKRAENNRRHWAQMTQEQRDAQVEKMQRSSQTRFKSRPTTIEMAVQDVLAGLSVPYQDQVHLGYYHVDILVGDNLVIECDGDYWHSLPKVMAVDKRRDQWLLSQGYKIARLKEHDIRKDAYGCTTEALTRFGVQYA
jgi:very-short-patch-repair endonuclease